MTRSRFLASLAIAATSSSVFSQGPISVQLHSSGHFQPVAYIQDPLNANTRFAVQKNGLEPARFLRNHLPLSKARFS